ncbi:MAG: transglutaminase-like domain-containing protein, partial [Coprobacillaceae bacterium]
MEINLTETYLLDYNHSSIIEVIEKNKWHLLPIKEAIQAVYGYVQNTIIFGYNSDDYIKASKVLKDGYGQCNTKSILLMAFLRRLKIPCRMHGFIVEKNFQKGCLKGLYYKFSPNEIIHGWVEVYYNQTWYVLEGVILDKKYVNQLQDKYKSNNSEFHRYAISTNN